MVTIELPEEVAAKLEAIAKTDGHIVAEVIGDFAATYPPQIPSYKQKTPYEWTAEEQRAALREVSGIFDDDISDLSETVRASVQNYLKKRRDGNC